MYYHTETDGTSCIFIWPITKSNIIKDIDSMYCISTNVPEIKRNCVIIKALTLTFS